MPLPTILDGFDSLQKQLFSYFWSQGKKSKISDNIGFFGKYRGFSGKYRAFSGNIEKSAKNLRFFADFFTNDFSFPKSFPTQPKTDFSPKNRPKKPIFWSLSTRHIYNE